MQYAYSESAVHDWQGTIPFYEFWPLQVQSGYPQCCCQDLFLGLETKTETLAIRSRDQDRDLDKMNSSHSSLQTMVSKSHHCLHQFQLVTEHSLKAATNYGNSATGVGTKHAVWRRRPRPWPSGLETETETWAKWTRLNRVHSSLETMVSRSQHWISWCARFLRMSLKMPSPVDSRIYLW